MYRNVKQERRLINSRIKVLSFFFLFLIFIVFIRVFYIQIVQNEYFSNKSKSNVIKESYIVPKRGDIVDRNGVLVADNRALYYVSVLPEKLSGIRKNKEEVIDSFITEVSLYVDLTDKEKISLKKRMISSPLFKEVVIKTDLSESELSKITLNLKYLKGVEVYSSNVRNYTLGDYFLPIVGYVGKIDKEEMSKYKDQNDSFTYLDYTGKSGLEKIYDNQLRGKHGVELTAINAYGRTMEVMSKSKPIQGDTLHLTIDSELQKIGYSMMGEETGAVVAIDPNNGDILSMVSTPTYDANKFIKGITQEEYVKNFSKQSPLFNRAITGQYPPASTFKPMVALAALSGKFVDPKEKIWCGPYYILPGTGRKFLDWRKQGHGYIDMVESIERSVDVYYYKVSNDMGIDYLHDYISHFGYGKKTGIILQGERAGILPSQEWKRKIKNEPWYKGETIISSIGQGYVMATPLQMALATSIIANGGNVYRPRLTTLEEIKLVDKININKEDLAIIKQGMSEVVYGKHGTASTQKKKLNYTMAAKTGTAQVFSTFGDKSKLKDLPKELRDHALFIAFAPIEKPEIAIAIVVENGEHGSTTAAPIAVEMINSYLSRKYNVENKELNK